MTSDQINTSPPVTDEWTQPGENFQASMCIWLREIALQLALHNDRLRIFDPPPAAEPEAEDERPWPRIMVSGAGYVLLFHKGALPLHFPTRSEAETYLRKTADLMNQHSGGLHLRWFCKECERCRRHCSCQTAENFEQRLGVNCAVCSVASV